jgi:hypothetical protein
MKFTVERAALEGITDQLKADCGVKGQQQQMMRLSACAARVFVEANETICGGDPSHKSGQTLDPPRE